jgi:hypothetical protein
MAYDPDLGKVVLFGGQTDGRYLPDDHLLNTWTYDGKTWTKPSPPTSPSARKGAALAYDPSIEKLVQFGGTTYSAILPTDTWTYDGTTWTQQHPTTPQVRQDERGPQGHSMAYDPAIGKLVLVGPNGTWTYDGKTWTEPPSGYQGGGTNSITYDATLRKLVTYNDQTTATYDGKELDQPGDSCTATAPGRVLVPGLRSGRRPDRSLRRVGLRSGQRHLDL